jgi:hypothetical protein
MQALALLVAIWDPLCPVFAGRKHRLEDVRIQIMMMDGVVARYVLRVLIDPNFDMNLDTIKFLNYIC